MTESTTIFLCGDVMTGRGIDQILPHSGSPLVHEPFMTSARGYVQLAESVSGTIPRPADFAYIWGFALDELKRISPDARVVNLETAVTRCDECWLAKDIHYWMSPENIPCLTVAEIGGCSVANNHKSGLVGVFRTAETLDTLRKVRIQPAGAGKNLAEAEGTTIFMKRGGCYESTAGDCIQGCGNDTLYRGFGHQGDCQTGAGL